MGTGRSEHLSPENAGMHEEPLYSRLVGARLIRPGPGSTELADADFERHSVGTDDDHQRVSGGGKPVAPALSRRLQVNGDVEILAARKTAPMQKPISEAQCPTSIQGTGHMHGEANGISSENKGYQV